MKWIKIEDGGHKPDIDELVLISGGFGGNQWWAEAIYGSDGEFFSHTDCASHECTHWARVEMPEE